MAGNIPTSYEPDRDWENLAKNLKRLMYEHNEMSFRDAAEGCGVDKGTITHIRTAKKRPSGSVLDKIAKFFDCSIASLFDSSEFVSTEQPPINADHRDLINAFDQCSAEGKKMVLRYAMMEARHS